MAVVASQTAEKGLLAPEVDDEGVGQKACDALPFPLLLLRSPWQAFTAAEFLAETVCEMACPHVGITMWEVETAAADANAITGSLARTQTLGPVFRK